MSIQTKEYIDEMRDMYYAIMSKIASTGDMSTTDALFLDIYAKTLKK